MLLMSWPVFSVIAVPACATVSCWELYKLTLGPMRQRCVTVRAVLGGKRGRHVIDDVLSQIRSHPCSCIYRTYTICTRASPPGTCQAFCGEPRHRASRTPELGP